MIRRKIGSRGVNISDEDNVDMVGEDLEEVHTISERGFGSNDADRSLKLSEKVMKSRNRSCDDVPNEDEAVSHDIECMCDVCRKSFFRKPDEISWNCPYCGQKFAVDDLEEVDTMSENPYKDVVVSDEQSVLRQDRFRAVFEERRSGKWEDGRKEQISLELGSDEYNEYVDDLQENHPDQPDDAFHAALEKRNEDMVTKNFDTDADNLEAQKVSSKNGETTVDIQKREEMQKRDRHAIAVREAIAAAALTDTLTDDQLARAITSDNMILYDKGVKPDEYIEALKEYVLDEPSL